MNTAALAAPLPTDPKELRPLLHSEVDRLSDADLAAAHRALLEIELRRLVDELGSEMDEAWASGQITQEAVDAAIKEYRLEHPHR